jgi:hypothetical protein
MDDIEDEEEVVKPKLTENEKKNLKYQVNKNFQEFHETKQENKNRNKKIKKAQENIRQSEYFKDLRNQFSEAPEEINPFGNTETEKYHREREEREIENFVREKPSKRALKELKKKEQRVEDISSISREYKNMSKLLKDKDQREFLDSMKYDGSQNASRGFTGKKRGRGDNKFSKGPSRGFKKQKY